MNLYPIEVSGDTNVSTDIDTYIIDANANDVNMTLPDMTGMGFGEAMIFKRVDTNPLYTVTITATGTTIDELPSITIPIGGFNTIVYDDDDWHTISSSGHSGYSGYSGYSGKSGYSGYSGISGYSGYSGISGYSGYSGISGYSGYSGISGYSGYSGVGLPAVGATGTIIISNGVAWIASTNTYPNTTGAGQILYATGLNVIGSATTLLTDGTYLLVGATSLVATEVGSFQKNQNAATGIKVYNSTDNNAASAYVSAQANTTSGIMYALGPSYGTSGILVADTVVFTSGSAATGGANFGSTGNHQASIWTNSIKRIGVTNAGVVSITNLATAGIVTNTAAGVIGTTALVPLANGGTNADLSGTGGASKVLKQTSAGAAITVAQLAMADLSDYATNSYTPNLFNTTNVAASTAYVCYYVRMGITVIVWGKVDIDPTTAATLTTLGMEIPIASNFANVNELGGGALTISNASGANNYGIMADATNNRATLQSQPPSGANISYHFIFSYTII